MNGTVIARAIARRATHMAQMASGAFERPEGVMAMVLASTIMTSICGYVVISNALDAQNAGRPAVELAASPAPRTAADRSYPAPEVFDTTVSVAIDRGPGTRQAPALAPTLAPVAPIVAASEAPQGAPDVPIRIIAGRPPVEAQPRPGGEPVAVDPVPEMEIVIIARGLSIDRARNLPRPATRPEGTTTPAWPDAVTGPHTSSLLAAVSPRPTLRPDNLVVRAAARPEAIDIEVARAETPETLGGIGESPRGPIFGGAIGDCSSGLTRDIPRRPRNARGGAAVMAGVGNGSGSGRDNALVQEALSGNVPDFLRQLHPVTFNGTVGGRRVEVTICVTPDYLAVGSDADNIRVPLGLPAALRVADAFDMMLPTTTMVDAIYRQADVRVAPSPMEPNSSMSSTSYFVTHDQTLDAQFARAGARQGVLVAGHKKDLVLANRLSRNPGRVAIYGWHRTNGAAIQPLSTVHGEYYADYSHGIRLVSRTAYVDGRAVDLRELLTDERYAGFLNSDGALTGATVRLASL